MYCPVVDKNLTCFYELVLVYSVQVANIGRGIANAADSFGSVELDSYTGSVSRSRKGQMDTNPDSERLKQRRVWIWIPDSDYVPGSRKSELDTDPVSDFVPGSRKG